MVSLKVIILLQLLIISQCVGFKFRPRETINEFKNRLSRIFIVPGTNWCGIGQKAESYDKLGRFTETDECCREHDFCPDVIKPGQSKYGLANNSFRSKVHCDCDLKLKECLNSIPSKISRAVRMFYFRILNTQCFKEDFPIIKCTRYNMCPFKNTCKKYEQDTSAPKRYQFFDVGAN